MPNDEEFRARFERAKRASTAQILFRTARLLNERALTLLRERSGVPIRASHTALFPHIDLEGTRLTELARRVGVSKQAVGQLVDELEQMGAVKRVPDPDDGRAKRVCFDEGGLLEGLSVLREVEGELAERIGVDTMRALHEGLLALLEVLEADASEDDP